MAVITESKPIAHELRDIARWFIHRATSEAEPETKQSHTNDALVCNKAADEIDRLRARLNTAGHAHVDGAHLSGLVEDCMLCDYMKERDALRAERDTLRERVAWLEGQNAVLMAAQGTKERYRRFRRVGTSE